MEFHCIFRLAEILLAIVQYVIGCHSIKCHI